MSHLGGTAFARSSDSGVTWQTLTANADCNYVANAGAVYYCTVESSKSVLFNALIVLAVAAASLFLFQCVTFLLCQGLFLEKRARGKRKRKKKKGSD